MELYKFLFLLLLLPGKDIIAATYHVDPASTAETPDGSHLKPWKNFSFLNNQTVILQPGDSLLLKRGELFFEVLDLHCEGSPKSPIIISGYGSSANKPVFMYRPPASANVAAEMFAIRLNNSRYVRLHRIEIADDHIEDADHHGVALVKIAVAIEQSHFITVSECSISRVGIGININGSNNLIKNCDISNLRMVRSTADEENDDYGANAVVIHGAENIIRDNRFSDCWAYSPDYGFDGGAIELFGAGTSNNDIVGNLAFNCNGFLEFGSDAGGIMQNNKVLNNTVLNCSDLLYINNGGQYSVTVKNLVFENNISIQTIDQLTKPKNLISISQPATLENVIILSKNIFWVTAEMNLIRSGYFDSRTLSHSGNIFFFPSGSLNLVPAATDRVLTTDSEIFKRGNSGGLSIPELYPFRYFLPKLFPQLW